jgi:hypothetical protein
MPDPFSLTLIELSLVIIGLVAGFLSVKINLVLIILLGRLFSSGTANRRYFVVAFFGFLSSFAWLGYYAALDTTSSLLSSLLFSIFLLLGALIGQRTTRLGEFRNIMTAVLDTSFPSGYHNFPGAVTISSVATSETLVHRMPYSLSTGLQLLLATFDSRTMVLLLSLRNGKLRWKRFVELSSKDRTEYLNSWRHDRQFSTGAHIIRTLTSYAYYVKPQTWPFLDYDGNLLRWSYLD